MTTFADVIARTRNYLMTGQPDRLNVLQTSIDADDVTVQFTYDLQGVNAGTVICIDLEEMHVVSVSSQAAGSSAQVIRAVNGSTATAHTANAIIEVAPQFSSYRLAQSINTAIQDISAEGLFRIVSVEFDFVPATAGYNITDPKFIDVWRVRYKVPGPMKDWPVLRPDMYRIDQAANTTDFAGGIQIVLHDSGYPGHPVRVSYKTGFNPLVTVTDDVLVVSGLHAEAHDIPALGAAIDLSVGREIKRTFLTRQPEPRRQEEVPPGSIQRSILGIMQHYDKRITMEKRRLSRKYPGAL